VGETANGRVGKWAIHSTHKSYKSHMSHLLAKPKTHIVLDTLLNAQVASPFRRLAHSPIRPFAVSSSHFFSVFSCKHSAPLHPSGNLGRSTTSPASVMPHLGN
jgi:hypothetical protein